MELMNLKSGISECLLCSSEAKIVIRDLIGYKESQKFDIFHCYNCNTSFSLPQPDDLDDIYELIYRNIKNIPNYYRYLHYSENVLKQTYPLKYLSENEQSYWGIRKVLNERTNKAQIRILEIGCGLGYLTYSLNAEGYSTTGIDISENAIAAAKLKFGDFFIHSSLEKFIQENNIRYDVIILTEVLEHLKNVKSFLKDASELLTEKGIIILTTPDKSKFEKYSGWYTDLPPVHSWWFSEKSITVLAQSIGSKANFVDFSKYYRNRPLIINLNDLIQEKPVFDETGNLKTAVDRQSSGTVTSVLKNKNNVVKKLIGEKLYNFLKLSYYRFHPGYICFGKRGFSICAVLTRN